MNVLGLGIDGRLIFHRSSRWEEEISLTRRRSRRRTRRLIKFGSFHRRGSPITFAKEMYSEHIIAFIDILAYSDLVENSDFEKVDRCVQIFLDAFGANDKEDILGRRTTYFSDTIITTIPVTNPNGKPQIHGLLYFELAGLCIAQAEMFDRLGLFVRGGITVGNLIHDEARIFGPGVIQGHKLEQQASFPRIIVDRALMTRYFEGRDLIASNHRRHSDDYCHIRPLMYREPNGDRSVDYLSQALTNLDDQRLYPGLLIKHRDAIRSGLKNPQSSVRAKYLWLSRYHDSTVAKTIKEDRRPEFLI